MSIEEECAETDSSYILVTRLDNAKNLSNLLKAIHFKEVWSGRKYQKFHFKIKTIDLNPLIFGG